MSITSLDVSPNLPENNPPLTAPRLRPRRTLNRLALAVAGVGLGGLAQYFFSQQSLWDGLLFYALAVVVFIRALSKGSCENSLVHVTASDSEAVTVPGEGIASALRPRNDIFIVGDVPQVREHSLENRPETNLQSPISNLQPAWRRNLGIWLVVVALGLSGLAFRFFDNEEANPQAWWLYLSSLMLLVGGGLLLTPGPSWRVEWKSWLPNRPIILGLAIVVGLALFMRLYNFTGQPYGIWYDEAEAGLQARRMLTDPGYRPVFYSPINITGHLLILYTLALNWLGDNIQAMRLVSVLFGLGAVAAAYLWGQELRGPRFGLLLAFLVAVARWHVNFSRIAMTGIDAPFFELLTLFFLTRLLKRGLLRDVLWMGLALGLGMMFYTAFRLFVLALLLFVIAACVLGLLDPRWRRWWGDTFRQSHWSEHGGKLVLLLATIWLVIMPLLKFAVKNPEGFWYRTNQISIFTRRDQPDLLQAVWESSAKHLLMFNFKGDSNGRHNLPGEPMLDPMMAIMGVLGLGLALWRWRQPANLFFLILLPVALTGGIFSVDFEAPQSLRSIAVIPALLYFVAIALAALGKEAEKTLQPLPPQWVTFPALGVLGLIFMLNAYTYFVSQANDFAAWNAFSTPETVTARKMAELGSNYRFFLSPFLAAHPTLRFVAPNITDQQILPLPDALPIREPADRPVALLIHPDDVWVFNEAQRLYPGAQFEVATSRTEEATPIVYFVNLQPLNLTAVQGLDLRYYDPKVLAGDDPLPPALHTERALAVQADWPVNLPPALVKASQAQGSNAEFVAEWSGVLYAPRYGPYSLRLKTPASGWLELDGNVIFEGQGEQLTGLPLAQGNHSLRIRAAVAPGQVTFVWQPPREGEALVPTWALYAPPVFNHGLLGTFYANDRWEGQPALQRIDPFLDTYFHFTPLPRPYTVEWTGSLDAPLSGVYRLGLKAVQEAQLYLDGNLLVGTVTPNELVEAPLTLQAGLHDLRLRFRDNTDRSRIHLYWTPPTGTFQPIPSQNLWPPLGRYPPRPAPPVAATQVTTITLNWLATLGGAGQFYEPRDVAVLHDGRAGCSRYGQSAGTTAAAQPGLVLTRRVSKCSLASLSPLRSRWRWASTARSRFWRLTRPCSGSIAMITEDLIDRFGGSTAFLFHPRGMTVFEDDTVVIADTGGSRLALFGADGTPRWHIGGLGSGPANSTSQPMYCATRSKPIL
ncbi:MAG: PA14 domain-containing protein [Anaerolineae bacterium]